MNLKKQSRIFLLFLLVNLLFVLKKLIELIMAIGKLTRGFNKGVFSEILMTGYKRWHSLKRCYLKKFSSLIPKNSLLTYLITRRQIIYGVIIILFSLTLIESSMTLNAKGVNFSSEEEIIEEGFPTLQDDNSPVNSEAIVQNITQPETEENIPEDSSAVAALDGSALIKPNILDEARPPTRTEIEEYIIQSGDNISTIAQKFGISVNSLLWANNLKYWSLIKIGKPLIIPPVSGVIHQVRRGDTIASLARTYKAEVEKIISFNKKLADGSDIRIGEKIIIPEGSQPYQAPIRTVAQVSTASVSGDSRELSDYINWTRITKCHKFAKGYCTSWVAYKWDTRRGQCVPKWGDAKNWLLGAINSGFSACTRKGNQNCQPRVGAIIVTSWSWYGHVGYIEKVEGDTVTFSEMNYRGWRVISRRTLNKNHWRIIGYIY